MLLDPPLSQTVTLSRTLYLLERDVLYGRPLTNETKPKLSEKRTIRKTRPAVENLVIHFVLDPGTATVRRQPPPLGSQTTKTGEPSAPNC